MAGADEDDGRDPVVVDVRFSYANERTFLAWIRTALGLVTAGLVITQLFPAFTFSGGRRLMGLPLIGLGAVMAALSYHNWQANEQAMRQGRRLHRSWLTPVSAVVVGAVAVTGLVLVLIG